MINNTSKILLVDDDPASNFLVKLLLEEMGFSDRNVVVRNNGKDAVDYLLNDCTEEMLPDVIFLDINMPVMNGFEFLDELKHTYFRKNIKIILLTSSLSPIDSEKAKNYSLFDYLNKPLTEEKLNKIFIV